MKKSEKGISLLIIVIIFLALAVISVFGYYAYLKFFKNLIATTDTNQVTSLETPQPTETATADTSWKNYSDTDFSFQYPTDATVIQPETGPRIIFVGPKQPPTNTTEFLDGYVITVMNLGTKVTVDINAAAEKGQIGPAEDCKNPSVSPVTKTLFAKQGANTYSYVCTNASIDQYFTTDTRNAYQITVHDAGDSTDLPEYQKITDKIIASFRFVQ